jgi:hypothetical protein
MLSNMKTKEEKEEEAARWLTIPSCPITGCPVNDPVMDPDGNTYERDAIYQWLSVSARSPMSREPLQIHQLIPNRAVKLMVDTLRANQESRRTRRRTGSKAIQLFLKTLTDQTMTISMEPTSTILELKKQILYQEGLPLLEQRLIFSGKQLQDHYRLMDYNVKHHSTLHLVLRLHGGGW